MVLLILTRQGFEDYAALETDLGPLWLAADVLSSQELADLRLSRRSVTSFSRVIELGDAEQISEALETIKEHHPGERVWVEA
jgi:hypothetical protein